MASNSANLPGEKSTFLFFLFLVNLSFTIGIHNDNFSEELYVKPFSSGHVMFHFQFTTVWNVSIDKPESCKHTLYTFLFLSVLLVIYTVFSTNLSHGAQLVLF